MDRDDDQPSATRGRLFSFAITFFDSDTASLLSRVPPAAPMLVDGLTQHWKCG